MAILNFPEETSIKIITSGAVICVLFHPKLATGRLAVHPIGRSG